MALRRRSLALLALPIALILAIHIISKIAPSSCHERKRQDHHIGNLSPFQQIQMLPISKGEGDPDSLGHNGMIHTQRADEEENVDMGMDEAVARRQRWQRQRRRKLPHVMRAPLHPALSKLTKSGDGSSTEDIEYLRQKLSIVSTMLKRLVLEHQGHLPGAHIAPQESPPPVLGVMTLNLWGAGHDWESRKQVITHLLQTRSLDVVALQEVHIRGSTALAKHNSSLGDAGKDGGEGDKEEEEKEEAERGQMSQGSEADTAFTQAHEVAREANYPYATAELFPAFSPKAPREGLGLLSKHPITHSQLHIFSHVDGSTDGNARGMLHARVNVGQPVGECDFFVTHLTYDDKSQCAMVVEMMDTVARVVRDPACIFILGDFNT